MMPTPKYDSPEERAAWDGYVKVVLRHYLETRGDPANGGGRIADLTATAANIADLLLELRAARFGTSAERSQQRHDQLQKYLKKAPVKGNG